VIKTKLYECTIKQKVIVMAKSKEDAKLTVELDATLDNEQIVEILEPEIECKEVN